jgi:outer membrane biosynthesis protein TonB
VRRVAQDGSVKEVEVLSGNPLLWDAARQAVMQWHYFPPFRQCSQPVEKISREFALSSASEIIIISNIPLDSNTS